MIDEEKYKEIIKNKQILSRLYESTDENIKECATFIQQGGVVGMPTETVYGLAANAFNVEACFKIFEYKGRPLSDPLIVHVCSKEMARDITIISNKEEENIFNILSDKFWPGPLTIVLEANLNKINTKILAGKTTVGIRYPINEIAYKLIKYSNVPIAAPSANKFCHISPVNPYHVFEDFKEFPIKILNGGISKYSMESTVIKIDYNNKKITVFRLGALSPEDIKEELMKHNINYEINVISKKVIIKKEENFDKEYTINKDAPGQFLKHYSPKLETYIYSNDTDYIKEIKLNKEIIFIDYDNILKNKFLNKNGITNENFLELSENSNAEQAMKNFYDYLHISENIKNKSIIIIIDLEYYMKNNKHKLTLLDRSWKAASFKKVKLIE